MKRTGGPQRDCLRRGLAFEEGEKKCFQRLWTTKEGGKDVLVSPIKAL